MYDPRDDDKPRQRSSLERQVMHMPSSPEALKRFTHEAKQDLREGKGLPNLQGDWIDLTTHYSFTKALEEGGTNLSPDETKAMAQDMSRRMDVTLNILDKKGLLEPMGFGFREKIGSQNNYIEGVAYVRDMSLFVITNPSLAHGDGHRRVFRPDEFYDIYEPPEDWR